MNRRDQNFFCTVYKIVFRNNFFCKIPIGHIGDDKFYFVFVLSQACHVGPVITFGFAGCRAFYVENYYGARIDLSNKHTRLYEKYKQKYEQLKK